MKIKSNIFTQLPKTPAGKEVYSFFLPKRYKLLMEKCMHDALDDYAAKVSKWNPEAGKVLDRPGIYDKTPFGADKQLYTDLRIWHSSVKPKGKVSFGEFSSYVDKAAANDEKTDYHPTAPTGVSQPLRLLLKCAWNLAYERGAGNATCRGFEIPGEGKAKAIISYKGAEPHDDNNLQALRPSSMKLIEQFAEFLGGKASVETTGSFHSIIIEMPVARERA